MNPNNSKNNIPAIRPPEPMIIKRVNLKLRGRQSPPPLPPALPPPPILDPPVMCEPSPMPVSLPKTGMSPQSHDFIEASNEQNSFPEEKIQETPPPQPPALPAATVFDLPVTCEPSPIPMTPGDGVIWRRAGDLTLSSRFMDILDRDEQLIEEIAATAARDGRLPIEFPVVLWNGEVTDGSTRTLGALRHGPDVLVPCVSKDFDSYDEARAFTLWTNRNRRQNNNRVLLRYVARHTRELDRTLFERVIRCSQPGIEMAKVHACTSSDYKHFRIWDVQAMEMNVSRRIIGYAVKIIKEADESTLTKVIAGALAITTVGGRLEKSKKPSRKPRLPRFLDRALPETYKLHILKLADEQNVDPSDIIIQLVTERLGQKLWSEVTPLPTGQDGPERSPNTENERHQDESAQ